MTGQQLELWNILEKKEEKRANANQITKSTTKKMATVAKTTTDVADGSNSKAVDSAQHNSRGRGRSEAEKRAAYARYRKLKKSAMEAEKRNSQYLILFPASDIDVAPNGKRFYNMGGNSAVIYAYEIGPRMGRHPKLRHDMDSGDKETKFKGGICSIADLDLFESKLSELGILKTDSMVEGLIFFKLNREYSKSEMHEMRKQEQKRVDQLNSLLYSKVLYPDIHMPIIELLRIVPVKVRKMERIYRDMFGSAMVGSVMRLARLYAAMTHGDMKELDAAKKMNAELNVLLVQTSMFNELGVWDIPICMRIGTIVVGLKQLLKGKIINKCEQ